MEAKRKPDGRAITWKDGSVMKDTIVWGDEFFDSDYTESRMRHKAFEIVHQVKFNENDPLHRKAWNEFLEAGYKLVEFDIVPRSTGN